MTTHFEFFLYFLIFFIFSNFFNPFFNIFLLFVSKMSERNFKQDNKQFINIGFDTRNQLKLFVGERSKTQFDSGCKMFDVYLYL